MSWDWLTGLFAGWNCVDWAFWAVVAYGCVAGIFRGLSHELAVLLSYAVAVAVTRVAYEPVADWLGRMVELSPSTLRLVSVLVLLAVVAVVMWGVVKVFGGIMSFAFKGAIERVGGALAGTFRWGLLAVLLMHILSLVPWAPMQRAILYDSVVGRKLIPQAESTYNEIAEKASLPPIANPTGLRLPDDKAFYMPPAVDE
jgi:uncharacterized membrane protein required for colicin V production